MLVPLKWKVGGNCHSTPTSLCPRQSAASANLSRYSFIGSLSLMRRRWVIP